MAVRSPSGILSALPGRAWRPPCSTTWSRPAAASDCRSCVRQAASRTPPSSRGSDMTSLSDAVVLVTGANGGLGTHFVDQALQRGAAKVYATARNPREWDDSRVVPIVLDVTDPRSVAGAAAAAPDVSIVINNAGALNGSSVVGEQAASRELFETNYWGALA